MPRPRITNGLLVIVLLAGVGFLLVYVPPSVVAQYDRVSRSGPPYTYLYWGLVGTGAVILGLLAGGIVLKLWQATRAKSRRLIRGAKGPSQLSDDEKQREVADNLAAVEALVATRPCPTTCGGNCNR